MAATPHGRKTRRVETLVSPLATRTGFEPLRIFPAGTFRHMRVHNAHDSPRQRKYPLFFSATPLCPRILLLAGKRFSGGILKPAPDR
jgi:hypothetical protein